MADVEGRLQAEVAETLGLSVSGAKSRIQRARRKLGEVLAACCAVEFGPDGRVSGFERQRQACRAENC
jgi:RNA polymerase sigma-70 factor (ECF subfamily)